MKLFGGSENFILQSFIVTSGLYAVNKNPDISNISIILSKAHSTENKIAFHTDTVTKENQDIISLPCQAQLEVVDNYKPTQEVITLFVEGVGRFNIEKTLHLARTFDMFKRVVLNEEYFYLQVTLLINCIVQNKSGQVEFIDKDLVFTTNQNCASFKSN